MQKIMPDTKIFEGRVYHFQDGVPTKADAQKLAKQYRAEGRLIRVVTNPNIRGYFLYMRKRY